MTATSNEELLGFIQGVMIAMPETEDANGDFEKLVSEVRLYFHKLPETFLLAAIAEAGTRMMARGAEMKAAGEAMKKLAKLGYN